MKSDVIQSVLQIGFTVGTVRNSFRKKADEIGLPFFSIECCFVFMLDALEKEKEKRKRKGRCGKEKTERRRTRTTEEQRIDRKKYM